jgi:hypothetical protein
MCEPTTYFAPLDQLNPILVREGMLSRCGALGEAGDADKRLELHGG